MEKMDNDGERVLTTHQRPLEWMRFDPVKFGLMVEGCSLEEEGAIIRLTRHIWNRGPLPESEVRRLARGNFEVVRALMFEVGAGLSFELVEEARGYGQRHVAQRVEAGKASASKRNDRSTTVKRKKNDRSTGVLSMSVSSSTSTSKSISEEEGTGETTVEIWPTFNDWWTLYDKSRDKPDCIEAYAKIDHATRERIYRHTELYVVANEKKFRKDPIRYLKKREWENEIIENGNTANKPITPQQAAQRASEYFARKRAGQPT